jgi:5-methylcytosine-specific restriction endonuclease McrA
MGDSGCIIDGKRTHIWWDDQPLGEMADTALAEKIGVTPSTVGSHRRARGIPRHSIWNDHMNESLLGHFPDTQVATMVGVSSACVRSARIKRNIPACCSGKRPSDTSGGKRVSIPPKQRSRILSRDGYTCRYCGERAPFVKITVDHVVPVDKGGDNEDSNLVACCWECNSGKREHLLRPPPLAYRMPIGCRR